MPKTNREKFMNLSEEKQTQYEQMYEQMYQASIITGQTPVPPQLANDPVERRNFLNWRHEFWVHVSGQAATEYRRYLDQPAVSGNALAETPPPYRSKS